jgi:DnaJ-class molecular chaperone
MRIQDRYASAIKSSSLKVDPRTTFSDTDVLGAVALASRTQPLGVALERLFAGDNGASKQVVAVLAQLARGKATALRIKFTAVQSVDMAQACLAWHRDGTCKPCGGHGVMKIKGTTTLGVQECKTCKGTARVPFEREFHATQRELARWLVAEMEREQAKAGPAAMAKIAPRLDF